MSRWSRFSCDGPTCAHLCSTLAFKDKRLQGEQAHIKLHLFIFMDLWLIILIITKPENFTHTPGPDLVMQLTSSAAACSNIPGYMYLYNFYIYGGEFILNVKVVAWTLTFCPPGKNHHHQGQTNLRVLLQSRVGQSWRHELCMNQDRLGAASRLDAKIVTLMWR